MALNDQTQTDIMYIDCAEAFYAVSYEKLLKLFCYNMLGKISVHVTAMGAGLDFAILPSATGKDLFDQVAKTLNIREIWYFGLQYINTKGFPTWLKMNERAKVWISVTEVTRQNIKNGQKLSFLFLIKFYPESIEEEIIEDATLKLLYFQVKDAIVSEALYCPPETSVLLASLAMQAKYGDYIAQTQGPDFHDMDRLLPQTVMGQLKLSLDHWRNRIKVWWADHKGMSEERAMLEFLKIAETLDMFGVNYFGIRNKKGTELELGVDALGLNVYERGHRLSPIVGLAWAEIRKISFNGKRLIIKPVSKQTNNIVFRVPCARTSEDILSLCVGNHELYMRRRKPDCAEVLVLRQQAEEKRKQKELTHQQLTKATKDRETAEKRERERGINVERFEVEFERTQHELSEARDTIECLQLQVQEYYFNEENLCIDRGVFELQGIPIFAMEEWGAALFSVVISYILFANLWTLKGKQADYVKGDEVCDLLQAGKEELECKERDVCFLREQVRLKQKLNNNERKRLDAVGQELQFVQHSEVANGSPIKQEIRRTNEKHYEQDSEQKNTAAQEFNASNHLKEAGSVSCYGGTVPGDGNERNLKGGRQHDLAHKLEALREDLERLRNAEQVTVHDLIHTQNKRVCTEKYDTLREIRSGSARRRIDEYENM
ncbi:unnamed protein product [Toxocara canis]|uniref:FERM domain-containing protein n=1 Tax=Toxocara canis TaxID=6265 RepID=A0A183UXX3_TOXCA|nr:unnamed protein product [Toxocara canis]